MEEPPVKPSVSKLAEKFKGQPFSIPTGHEEKPTFGLAPASKGKHRNSALIEKLQANLSLSPTSLLPLSRNPEVKPKPTGGTPPATPPLTPTGPPQPASKEEVPTSFEAPAEGSVLHSFNKGRARLSVKRRPPTRQHRKSCNEEVLSAEDGKPLYFPDSSKEASGQELAAEATGNDHDSAAPTPAPAVGTGTDEDSRVKEAPVQEEDDVFTAESSVKVEDTAVDAGKEASEQPLSACAQEPQPNTQCGETEVDKENQPSSPGD
ncbi:capZ-interacting protein [Arapaima gigas]